MKLVGVVVMLGAILIAPAASAGRCKPQWSEIAGTISPGARCGSAVLTTDGATAQHSVARAGLVGTFAGDVRFTVTLRRLSADAGPIHVAFPGGYLMLRDGEVGLYVTEAQWSKVGWQPLPDALAALRLSDSIDLSLELRGDVVTAHIGEVELGRWEIVDRPRAGGSIVVWLFGPRGTRSRALLRDPVLTPLGDS
jgi:hypothetical protein